MKLWKAFTNSMINLLSVLDNFTEGTNELSLMYKDACHSARQEQALEPEGYTVNPHPGQRAQASLSKPHPEEPAS